MKKFLAALLAVLMLLSAFATCIVSVSAADAAESNDVTTEEVDHRVTMSDADAYVDGWTWNADAMLPLASADSKGCISLTFQPGEIAPVDIQLRYEVEKTGVESYDLTGYTYCVFDFYISDADLYKENNAGEAKFVFELTSSGHHDEDEFTITDQYIDAWIEGGLQDGWNKVKIPFTTSTDSELDITKWNFMRIYNAHKDNASIIAPEGLTVAIDNFGFCNDTDTLIVDKCDPNLDGWSGSANAIKIDKVTGYDDEKDENIITVQNAMGTVLPAGTYPARGWELIWNAPEEAVDISNMKYIEFDLYVSDAAVLPTGRNIWIELSSSGQADKEEISAEFWKSGDPSMGLKEGWNHIQLSLELFTKPSGAQGDFDATALNYFRFYNNTGFTLTENFTIAIDNVTFWDGMIGLEYDKYGNLSQGREVITFKPGSEDAKQYEYKRDEWVLDGNRNDQHRASNNEGVFMYQFPIENADTATSAIFSATMAGQILLSVSTDGEHWKEVYKFEDAKAATGSANNRKASLHAFDLTEYVIDEDGGLLGNVIYIKVEDSYGNVNGGWGGQIHFKTNATMDVVYDIPKFDSTDAYTFTVGTENEKTYLVNEGTGFTEKTDTTPAVRYADETDEIIYKYPLERTEHLDRVSWSAALQGQYSVSVSIDGENWTNISSWVSGNPTDTPQVKLLDLSAGVDMSGKVEFIWVKISDADMTDADGGAIVSTRAATLQVTYYNAEAIIHENISFTVGTEDEEAYLINGNGEGGTYADNTTLSRIHDNGSVRFADKTRYFTYIYDLSSYTSLRGLTWTPKIGAWYHIFASADGENWVEIAKADEKKAAAVVSFDLSKVLADVVETKKLYVKICDAVTTDGYGPAIYVDTPVILNVAHIPLTADELDALEMTGNEHSRPLWGCNENWPQNEDDDEPHGWVVDIENQTAGSGCLSLEIDPTDYNAGGIELPAPVSGVGMDTLEFELWLSDLAILDMETANIDEIELSSSGTMDKQEWSFRWETMFNYIQGEPQVGWNHVAIPMDKASRKDDTFRLDNINWIRLYHNPSKKTPEGWVIKIDNFRLTDAIKYAEEEEKREQQEMLNKHVELINEIKTLDIYKTSTSITAENYEAAKAAILAIREKVDALPEEELQILSDANALKALKNAEETLQDYEADVENEKQVLEENQALLEEIDALSQYTTITAENFEAAKAAIEGAAAKYDALKKSVRNILEDNGYLAKLEAAEAALDAYTNGGSGDNSGTNLPGATDDGCKSALTVGAGAMMLLAAAWVSIAARKKED